MEPLRLKLEYDRVEVSKGNLLLDAIRVFGARDREIDALREELGASPETPLISTAFLVQSRNYLSSVVFTPSEQDILGGILKPYQADQGVCYAGP